MNLNTPCGIKVPDGVIAFNSVYEGARVLNFLNPLFLIGLVTASIPLLIHFLNRNRASRRDFSTLIHLKNIDNRKVRKIQLRQWLLLLLRTLIIILLVMIPARPVVTGLFSSTPADHVPTDVVMIVDVSASMGYVGDEGSAEELMHNQLSQVLGWMNPASDRCQIILANSLTSMKYKSWQSPDKVLDDLSSGEINLTPTSLATDLSEAFREAQHFVLSSDYHGANREIYIFSDFQKGSFSSDTLKTQGDDFGVYLVQSYTGTRTNRAITFFSPSTTLLSPGVPLKLEVGISSSGNQEDIQVYPRIYENDKLVGQGDLQLSGSGFGSAIIEIPPLEPGIYMLQAQIDADGLKADNSRSLALEIPSIAQILYISSEERDSYLDAALSALSSSRLKLVELTQIYSTSQIRGNLSGKDLAILKLDGKNLRSMDILLKACVQENLPLIIIPSKLTDLNAANKIAGDYLPYEISASSVLPEGGYLTLDLSRPGPGPAAAGEAILQQRLVESLPQLDRIKFYATSSFSPAGGDAATAADGGSAAGPGPGRDMVLRLSGGGELLRVLELNGTKAAIFSLDIGNPQVTELPETPMFLPFLYSLVQMMTERGISVQREVVVGEPVVVTLSTEISGKNLELLLPDESRFSFPPGDYRTFSYKDTKLPGVYSIYGEGELLGAFAAGIKPAESNVEVEEFEQIEKIFSGGRVSYIEHSEQLVHESFSDRRGREIWRALVIIVLVLLLLEQVVSRSSGKVKEEV